MFIDETWATTAMARRYGRARRGARVVGAVPRGHRKTTTVIAALRHDGLTAPCVFDGALDGSRFLAYVEQALGPTLRPGDVVVLDNLRAPKVKDVRAAIAAAGAELVYLPPYSPERRGPHRRSPLAHHRPAPRCLHADRMRPLPRPCRLCST